MSLVDAIAGSVGHLLGGRRMEALKGALARLPRAEIDALLSEARAATQAAQGAAARGEVLDRMLSRLAAQVGVELSTLERALLRNILSRVIEDRT